MQHTLALTFILLAGVASNPVAHNGRKANFHHKLLLISFDGFRWNYDQDVETPNMDKLVKDGVKAKYVSPPFVTMTSPSHFTIITGKCMYIPVPSVSPAGKLFATFFLFAPFLRAGKAAKELPNEIAFTAFSVSPTFLFFKGVSSYLPPTHLSPSKSILL